MRFVVNCDQNKQIVGTFHHGSMTIHSIGQTISSFLHIEYITLGAGEEVYKVAGRANDMALNGKGEEFDSIRRSHN